MECPHSPYHPVNGFDDGTFGQIDPVLILASWLQVSMQAWSRHSFSHREPRDLRSHTVYTTVCLKPKGAAFQLRVRWGRYYSRCSAQTRHLRDQMSLRATLKNPIMQRRFVGVAHRRRRSYYRGGPCSNRSCRETGGCGARRLRFGRQPLRQRGGRNSRLRG